jgi:DNA-binding CsgD family transcriptional regulator
LAGISQVQNSARESLDREVWGRGDEALHQALRPLPTILNNSTVGVALFDRTLHCRALNGALARMNGVPVSRHIGETLQQLFPSEAPKLEPAFQRVWDTHASLSNVELSVQLPTRIGVLRWLANFYPIDDESGQVRLVAATFSEVTKRSSVESRLGHLTDRFRADVCGESNFLGEGCAKLSARTLELVQRSVELVKRSMSLRRYVSERRLETELEHLALFLTVTRQQEVELHPALPSTACGAMRPPLRESPDGTDPPAGPSPRERQVLCLLADGKSNKEIGALLDLSARTVECYRARIMLKLDLHSTAALVRYAVRNKIVEA